MKLIKGIVGLFITFAILCGAVWGIYRLFPLKYLTEIRTVCGELNVDPYLVAALIKAESNFNMDAISRADAKGVMQLTDETAEFCAEKLNMELAEGDIYSPKVNIRLGSYYLKRMLDLFEGDEALAIAAYNAGAGRVKKWLKNPEYSPDGESLQVIPYEETKNHVKKIEAYKKIYKILYPNI
ncbi:MAG: lytic transglycosylase domain-containing protein [Clostridia bacterium]|nr:lytic transglycosylase domain-containing protein [Clostridia bacterium]